VAFAQPNQHANIIMIFIIIFFIPYP